MGALLAESQAPVTTLTNQMNQVQAQKQAYTSLSTQLTSMQTIGQSLQLPSSFQASTATSSNTQCPDGDGRRGRCRGHVPVAGLPARQLAAEHHRRLRQQGAGRGRGPLTVEMGGGSLATEAPLSQLNGGKGVSARTIPHHRRQRQFRDHRYQLETSIWTTSSSRSTTPPASASKHRFRTITWF